jgi:hypothetical protein
MTDLLSTQRWLQDFIVDPREDDVVSSANARAATTLVQPSATLTGLERAQIYRDMYLLRMHDALASDFAALKRLLGDHGFEHLTHDYVQQHPSTSYTLNALGRQMPEFLQSYPDIKRRDFASDLARLELAVTEMFDAPRSPRLDVAALGRIDDWDAVRVVPISALRLLRFSYPVNDYLDAVQNERPLPRTPRRASYVVVYRPTQYMQRRPLSQPQYKVLAALLAGRPLYDAFAPVLGGSLEPFAWFREWVEDGMFSRLDVSADR